VDEGSPLRAVRYPYRAQAETPADFRFLYDKIPVEERLRRGPVPLTTLRLPMVYGPEDPRQRVERVLRDSAESHGELHLNPAEAAWRCTRGYVEDGAGGIALAAADSRAAGATFNLGETTALSEGEWREAVAGAAGQRARVRADPAVPVSMPADWSVPLVVETRSIRERLDYREPVGRDEGLRRSVARWRGRTGTE
jgi:nucleoside-diphosphate-sugar epimerase